MQRFFKTSIGQKYRDDQQLMEEPTKVYWILEQERERMTPDGIDGIRSVPDFHKGIDFTDMLKKLKEKTD